LIRIFISAILFGIGLTPLIITYLNIKDGDDIGIKNEILFVVFAGIVPGTFTGMMMVTYFDKVLVSIHDCFGINDWY
jgi:hypothetical protein